MAFWVYILKCSDGTYYTGHTDDIDKRLGEHIYGRFPDAYTYRRRPVVLIFSQEFPTRLEALETEARIKGWSRKKKEALMASDWEELSRLSHRKKARSSES
ncbi:MAG: GIY-YIG nuclease family protein [Sphingomonadales bacterium]